MCRIKVKTALIDLVHKSLKPNVASVDLSTGVSMLTKDADVPVITNIIKKGNAKYDATIISYTRATDNDLPGYVTITPSEGMIDKYYPLFEEWEAKKLESKNKITDLTNDKLDKPSIFRMEKPTEGSKKNTVEDYDGFGRFFNSKTTGHDVQIILGNIVDYYQNLNTDVRDVLGRIDLLSKYANPSIKFVSSEEFETEDTLMEYVEETNTILVSKDTMEGMTAHEVAEVFLHEVVHSVTTKSLAGQTLDAKLLRSKITDLFEAFKAIGDTNQYGFTSVEEFVAEAFTSSEFQAHLKGLDTLSTTNEPVSLWSKFINFIKQVLGKKGNDNYTKTISSIVDVIKAPNGITEVAGSRTFQKVSKNQREFKEVDLSTTENKVQRLYTDLQNSLDAQSRQLKNVKYNQKGNLGELKRANKELIDTLEKYESTNQFRGILSYIDKIGSSIQLLENTLNKPNISQEDMESILSNYKKYHSYYSAIDDIKDLYKEVVKDPAFPNITGSAKVLQQLKNLSASHVSIGENIAIVSKLYFKKTLNDIRWFPKVEASWTDKLTREYNSLYKGNSVKLKDKSAKRNWINRKMIEHKEDMQEDVDGAVAALIDNPAFDISYFTTNFMSALETNSDIVQMVQAILSDMRNSVIEELDPIQKALSDKHAELVKAKGTSKPKELYANMVDKDAKGNLYYKGEYSAELHSQLKKYDSVVSRLNYYDSKSAELKDEEMLTKMKELRKQMKELSNDIFIFKDNKRVFNPKYKNNLSGLSKIEKESLELLKKQMRAASSDTQGFNSLVDNYYGVEFIKAPSITKNDYERLISGDAKGTIKDKWTDLTTIKADDTEYGHLTEKASKKGYKLSLADPAGNIVNEIPIHFRRYVAPKDQSMDLFGMTSLEAQNGIAFKHRKSKEILLTSIVDTAKGKSYYKTNGISNTPLLNKYIKKNDQLTTNKEEGANSNTVKRLEGLLESQLYDITRKSQGEIMGVDTHKLVNFINGYTGMVGMSLNYHSGLANLAGGYAQFLMSAITKDTITLRSLKKAGGIYRRHSMDNLQDIGKTFDDSFTNQINKMFDVFGGMQIGKSDFLKDNVWKSFANLHSLQMFNNLGEHQMQSVITMAILDEVKALNKDGDFMTKDGKVTKDASKAASLLDMLSKDENGLIKMHDNVVFSEHSNVTEWDKGGKVQVQQLIKHKVFKLIGNYDDNLQPEIMKAPLGRLGMMYRRFFIPMYMNRFRSGHLLTKKTEDIKDYERFFSYSSKRYEEGMYVTAGRFVVHGLVGAMKQRRLRMVTEEWQKLTEYERANILKTVYEVGMATLASILSGMLAAADDDDEMVMFWAYMLRRTESELAQYRNPREFTRMMKSPFAGLRSINNFLEAIGRLFDFPNWNEQYSSGDRQGDLKLGRSWEKLIPVLGRDSTNANKYEYLESPFL